MANSVATKKDIKITVALQHNQQPNWQGKWVAEPMQVESYDYFKLNNQPIVHKATCTFNFRGTDPTKNGAPVQDQEIITLTAKKTTLQPPVLCHGDEETGQKSNKLQVHINNNYLTTD